MINKIIYKNKKGRMCLLCNITLLRNVGDSDKKRLLEIQLINSTADLNEIVYIKGLTSEEIDKCILSFFENDKLNLCDYNIEVDYEEDTSYYDDDDFDVDDFECEEETPETTSKVEEKNYDIDQKRRFFKF